MMRSNGVNHFGRLSIFFGKLRSNQSMGAFHFMVNGFANIMQEPHSTRQFLIQPQFSRHDAAQESDFDRMLENVLRVAGAEFEFSNSCNQIIAEIMHT